MMEKSKTQPFSMKKFVQNTNQLLMTLQKLQEMVIKLGNQEKSTSRSFNKLGNTTGAFVEAVNSVEEESNHNIRLLATETAKRKRKLETKDESNKPSLFVDVNRGSTTTENTTSRDDGQEEEAPPLPSDEPIEEVVISELLNEVLHNSLLKMAQIHDHGYKQMAKKIAATLAQDREKITQSIRSLQQNYDHIKKEYSNIVIKHRKLKSKQEKTALLAQELWIQLEQQTKQYEKEQQSSVAPHTISKKQLDALHIKVEKAQTDARKQTVAYQKIHKEVMIAHQKYVQERNAVMRAFIQYQSIIKHTIKSTLQSYVMLKRQIIETYLEQVQHLHQSVEQFPITAPINMMNLSLTVNEPEPFEPYIPCYDKSEYEQRRLLEYQQKAKKKSGFLGLFSGLGRPKSPNINTESRGRPSPFSSLATSRVSNNPLDELLPPVPKSPLQMIDTSILSPNGSIFPSSTPTPVHADVSEEEEHQTLNRSSSMPMPSLDITQASPQGSSHPPSPNEESLEESYAEVTKIKDSKELLFFQKFVDVIISQDQTPPTTKISATIWEHIPLRSSPLTSSSSSSSSSSSTAEDDNEKDVVDQNNVDDPAVNSNYDPMADSMDEKDPMDEKNPMDVKIDDMPSLDHAALVDEARLLIGTPSGRLAFAQSLHIKREHRCLSPQAFQIFVDLVGAVLRLSHEQADPNVGRLLLNMCQTFYKDSTNVDDEPVYLLSCFRDHPIFQNVRFWESSFFDTLNVERKKFYRDAKSAQWASMNSAQRVDADVHHKNMVFGVLGSFVVTMQGVGVPQSVIVEFLDKMCSINELSSEYVNLLHANL